MEWIGFLVVAFVGCFAVIGGVAMVGMSRAFGAYSAGDRFAGHVIFAIGVGILWFAYEHAPFAIVLK